jgi:hypothetical protein
MTKKELLKQLHNLNREIKPDAAWKASNRDILVSQINAQTSGTQIDHKVLWHGLLLQKFVIAAYRPVGAMILIIGIVLGGYTMTVGATKNSLPGDFLYPIKLTGERMQVNIAGSDEKKANLEITFAERRLAELQKVSDKGSSDLFQKENLQVSLLKYQESINNVKNSLSKLEKTDSKTAVKVAKLIDEKTKGYVDILTQQNDSNPDLGKTAGAKDALNASQSMAEKALDVIINEYKAGSKEVTIDNVIQSLEKKMVDLNSAIIKDKADLDKIIANAVIAKDLEAKKAAEEAASAKAAAEEAAKAVTVTEEKAEGAESVETPAINENANINKPVEEPVKPAVDVPAEILPIPGAVKARFTEVQDLLAQAKGYLLTKEVLWSYARMNDAQDILNLIEKVIEANKQYLEAPKEEVVEPAKVEASANTNANVNSAP